MQLKIIGQLRIFVIPDNKAVVEVVFDPKLLNLVILAQNTTRSNLLSGETFQSIWIARYLDKILKPQNPKTPEEWKFIIRCIGRIRLVLQMHVVRMLSRERHGYSLIYISIILFIKKSETHYYYRSKFLRSFLIRSSRIWAFSLSICEAAEVSRRRWNYPCSAPASPDAARSTRLHCTTAGDRLTRCRSMDFDYAR